MRWVRIGKLSATLALAIATALFGPPVIRQVNDAFRAYADSPRPIAASSGESRAIIAAILNEMEFAGIPPPPPERGEAPRSAQRKPVVVISSSVCESAGKDGNLCSSRLSELLSSLELDSFAPSKLRRELVIANEQPHPLDVGGLPHVLAIDSNEISAIFDNGGWWNDFYKKYPNTSGFAVFSLPVLSEDKQQALVYVAHHCDGLCGTGTLLLLERSTTGWHVVKVTQLWIS